MATGEQEDRTGEGQGWGNGECARGLSLPHLAHCTGPGLQTVSSICTKMLDPPPSEDELKGKGEPAETMRSGPRWGSRSGCQAGDWEEHRELLPVKVTGISRWGADTQTYNILGLDEAEGFRTAFRGKHFQSCSQHTPQAGRS